MKLLIAVCTLLVLFFKSSAKADCSSKSWTVVPKMSASEILGRWHAVLGFANENDTFDCLWHDIRMHPTIPNAVKLFTKRTFKNGTSRKSNEIEGVLTPADPADLSITKGLAHVAYTRAGDVDKYITAANFNIFAIVRACFRGEGNLC